MAFFYFIFSLFFAFNTTLTAREYAFLGSYSAYPPSEWQVLDVSDNRVVFSDAREQAFFQINIYPGDKYSTAEEIFNSILTELDARGDGAPFLFSGRKSYLGDITFQSGGYRFRGYLACIEGEVENRVVLSFAAEDYFEHYHDQLLSCLDSFALSRRNRREPGLVSQFYYPFPGPEKSLQPVFISDRVISIPFDPNIIEISQLIIDREARVLAPYGESPLAEQAWQRYYRMLYRDNYNRMGPFVNAVKRELLFPNNEIISYDNSGRSDIGPAEISKKLLEWIQGFIYIRTGGDADLLNPVEVFVTKTGDCDSRGLLYLLLLHHLDINAILMVSWEYGHSMVGVDIDGAGARFEHENILYLVAETTEKVDIGLINQEMADPAGWIGINFE